MRHETSRSGTLARLLRDLLGELLRTSPISGVGQQRQERDLRLLVVIPPRRSGVTVEFVKFLRIRSERSVRRKGDCTS